MPQAWMFVNLMLFGIWLWLAKRAWINREGLGPLAVGGMALLLAEHAFIRVVNDLVDLLNASRP